MIFISYNHDDQQLIDMIARRLELEFGRNNIFYDRWSMQPGDSITGKMNEGLERFTTFFFFLSPNSLTSNMVRKEWQSALMRAIGNGMKFVPVRIADCNPPAILQDALYIDLYGIGLDDAVAQMKCVVKGENTYQPLQEANNLVALIQQVSDLECKIEIRATMYTESGNHFMIAHGNSCDDIDLGIPGSGIMNTQTGTLRDNQINVSAMQQFWPLTPTHPVKIIVKSKTPLEIIKVMHVVGEHKAEDIPAISAVLTW